jgi:AcrR family transcriptional regulator
MAAEAVGAGGRSDADGDSTRARILRAAIELFAREGFDGTTTRTIAAAAGVNHAMIVYHFRTKDALWRASVTTLFEKLWSAMDHVEDADAGLPASTIFVRRYLRYCTENPEHTRMLAQESVRGGKRLQWVMETFGVASHAYLDNLVRSEQAAGHLPQSYRMSLVYILLAACHLPFALANELRVLYGVDPHDPRFLDLHAEAVARLLTGERGEPPARSMPPGGLMKDVLER